MDFPKILYDDKDFLAVYKPYGMLTHGTGRGDKDFLESEFKESLADWVLKKYPETATVGEDPVLRPGVVHRLDRDTSGVIVIAKNQESFLFLKNLFKERKIEKKYIAIVFGKINPKDGVIDMPIGLKSGTIKRTVFSKVAKMMKEAVTEYKTLKILEDGKNIFSVIELRPLTGRTHQLRVHLNSINHPVAGDLLYGGKKNCKKSLLFFGNSRLFLHAKSLEFTDRQGKRIKVEIDPPGVFQEALDRF
ncbi:MAG: RluA family pseudouridine synthase [Candidatus Pacebacteria bacterium]|nr:RluA family pseudouridine synthase [Candidatus Paceibacterota bacterium]